MLADQRQEDRVDPCRAEEILSGRPAHEMALVGAYVLARELANHDDATAAFAAYERIVRPYMEANQALATRYTASIVFPRTQEDLDAGDRMLASLQGARPGDKTFHYVDAEAAHSALKLPA